MKLFTRACLFLTILIQLFLFNVVSAQYLTNLSNNTQELNISDSKNFKNLDRLVVFGDSLSDTGNLYNRFLESFPLSPPYFEGHFSNGPVWVSFLKKTFNIPQPAIYNYAFGGARVIQTILPLPGLESQVSKYIETSGQHAEQNGMYVIWMGSNDIVFDKQSGNKPDIEKMVEITNAQIEKLVQIGAKNFLVLQLPNLGYSPEAFELDKKNGNTEYSQKLQKFSVDFNTKLTLALKTLADKYPEVTILSFETYSFFEDLIKNFKDFGFLFTEERCNPNWYATPLEDVCTNPNEYLFWDAVHPTTRSHELLANAILKEMQESDYGFTSEWNIDEEALNVAKNHKAAVEGLISDQVTDIIKKAIFDSFT